MITGMRRPRAIVPRCKGNRLPSSACALRRATHQPHRQPDLKVSMTKLGRSRFMRVLSEQVIPPTRIATAGPLMTANQDIR